MYLPRVGTHVVDSLFITGVWNLSPPITVTKRFISQIGGETRQVGNRGRKSLFGWQVTNSSGVIFLTIMGGCASSYYARRGHGGCCKMLRKITHNSVGTTATTHVAILRLCKCYVNFPYARCWSSSRSDQTSWTTHIILIWLCLIRFVKQLGS